MGALIHSKINRFKNHIHSRCWSHLSWQIIRHRKNKKTELEVEYFFISRYKHPIPTNHGPTYFKILQWNFICSLLLTLTWVVFISSNQKCSYNSFIYAPLHMAKNSYSSLKKSQSKGSTEAIRSLTLNCKSLGEKIWFLGSRDCGKVGGL